MSWTCPYCNHKNVVTERNRTTNRGHLDDDNVNGPLNLIWRSITCLNESCKQLTLEVFLRKADGESKLLNHWKLLPEGSVRPFPSYVPAPILGDYKEAVLIKDLSPKASATLARRCLQGMIRDVWGVKPARLVDEIKSIEDKIETGMWKAIDAVRSIGNIGAHMENDINVIVDVDPDEAELLIGLLELLIQEWYVERHDREERVKAITALADEKKALKKAK
ncbi:hypothetical protein CHU32_03635 [Superficieibacter electus]|uniref:DUF4145 domain-containing protein n=1 Tax=Superficieibacter electus TaxID=2022662 RepID=A0A2P5GVF4_9ENTR|nr:DUF4145 domain-containing protein [Superficieibacter electus]POP42339.1 hypothetical protein CHU33_19920 [Superficieibacter electus]POP50527.1 hypothetical protein CHU32_03635 [Superficieibacter electus]